MTPRKFKARSIQAAVQKIKEELGPDAMILSTRRISANVKDPYNKELFEVTAVAQTAASGKDRQRPSATEKIKNKYLLASEAEQPQKEMTGLNAPPAEDFDASDPAVSHPSSEAIQGLKENSLQSELAGIKDLLYLLNETKGFSDFFQAHPECLTLYKKLIKAGISEKRVQRLMKTARNVIDNPHPTPQMITKNVLETIYSTIDVINPFCPAGDTSEDIPSRQQLVAFIGPTGAGKTTTIAKLAADLGMKQKKAVGLISIDSYRVGALEQLKVYSSIMGLPCLPAFSQQDLAIAVRKMRHKDVVLIDTAGHGHMDEKRMGELARLMGGAMDISSHLVLSVTTNREDMKDAAKHFNLLKPQTYIFTKIDETRRRGVMIDQIEESGLPISFLTNGQRVPEDIITASPKKILDLILKQEI